MSSSEATTHRLPVLAVSEPIGDFFIGILPAKVLRTIAYSDIRRLQGRSIESYTGIERPLSPQRVAEIKQYIRNVDATFPNSIIVAIKREDITDTEDGFLSIRVHDKVAKIIDGQHRLAGFEGWDDNDQFDLVVAIFIEMDEEDQATVFATINLKQTKVSRSLVFDLFELTKTRSPQKTCHEVAKTLNSEEGSPFFHRIKLLGRNPDFYKGTLTQGTFIKYLIPLISRDPDGDRNRLKKGERIVADDKYLGQGLIFRNYFAREEDWAILRVMRNFFTAITTVFPEEWNNLSSPLPRAIGFGACMRVLPSLFLRGLGRKELTQQFFETSLAKAKGRLALTFDEYPANAGGESRLAKDLSDSIGLQES